MDYEEFWRLIDSTRSKSNGDGYVQADLLVEELVQLSEADIIVFDKNFQEYMNQAYSNDLWAAAYIINCGCSGDGFMDFRAWLIGQGLEVFEEALKNPEILADVVKPGTDTQIQKLMNVAKYAYLAKKHEPMPSFPTQSPDLIGDEWQESMLSQKYPKLHSRFGDCAQWAEFFRTSRR